MDDMGISFSRLPCRVDFESPAQRLAMGECYGLGGPNEVAGYPDRIVPVARRDPKRVRALVLLGGGGQAGMGIAFTDVDIAARGSVGDSYAPEELVALRDEADGSRRILLTLFLRLWGLHVPAVKMALSPEK